MLGNKTITVSIAIVALLAVSASFLYNKHTEKNPYTIKRNIRYSFTLQNTSTQIIQNAEFWAYAPVKQTSWQKSGVIEASHPYALQQDELGNQILHFSFDKLPPFATEIINIKADVLFSTQANKTDENHLERFLAEESFMEISSPNIKQLALQIKQAKQQHTAEKTFNWVANNIKYAGYIKDERGALYAMKSRQGDCTEYMYLNTALLRANQIPSRGIGGYVYSEDRILKPTDYHNWSEAYLENAWRIIDPQNKKYMTNQSHYIAMRIVGHTSTKNRSSPLSNSQRFAFVGEGLSVRMN